jgi:hypothetical protein
MCHRSCATALRIGGWLLIGSGIAGTLACEDGDEPNARTLPPGAGPVDAAAQEGAVVDAGTVAVPNEDAGPCRAEGTWRIDYDCAVESDLVFVTADAERGYRVRFVDRRPPAPIDPATPAVYSTTAAFDPSTCTLWLESNVRWIDSGMGYCGDHRQVSLVLEGSSGTGMLARNACGDFSGTCTASAERVAAPGACPVAAKGNVACSTSAICDSGCGSACTCESGRWTCDFPKRGAACLGDEACSIERSALGGSDALGCVNHAGTKFLDGSLRDGGDVCTDLVPVSGHVCPNWAGQSCGACVCTARDGGPSSWSCQP